jgi:hypothetical protein
MPNDPRIEAKVQAVITVTLAIGDTIRALGSIPSDDLYVRCMHVLSLEAYESIINRLVQTKFVRRDGNHLLTWVGPRES